MSNDLILKHTNGGLLDVLQQEEAVLVEVGIVMRGDKGDKGADGAGSDPFLDIDALIAATLLTT